MHPPRRNLRQRLQHKPPLLHLRMRQRQLRRPTAPNPHTAADRDRSPAAPSPSRPPASRTLPIARSTSSSARISSTGSNSVSSTSAPFKNLGCSTIPHRLRVVKRRDRPHLAQRPNPLAPPPADSPRGPQTATPDSTPAQSPPAHSSGNRPNLCRTHHTHHHSFTTNPPRIHHRKTTQNTTKITPRQPAAACRIAGSGSCTSSYPCASSHADRSRISRCTRAVCIA